MAFQYLRSFLNEVKASGTDVVSIERVESCWFVKHMLHRA